MAVIEEVVVECGLAEDFCEVGILFELVLFMDSFYGVRPLIDTASQRWEFFIVVLDA